MPKAFILAGGRGFRLFPLSTRERPKQFVKLIDGKSLLRATVERVAYGLGMRDIYVVTNERYAELVRSEIPELPIQNILVEPSGKGTLPSYLFALMSVGDVENALFLPSDAYIGEIAEFWAMIEKGERHLNEYGGVLLFGVEPRRAETDYGYIELSDEVKEGIYKVASFREKPKLADAVRYVFEGKHLWNTGINMFKRVEFIEMVARYKPMLIEAFRKNEDVCKAFELLPDANVSKDLFEIMDNVYALRCTFEWSDVGTWKALKEIGIEKRDKTIAIDSDVYVYSEKPTVVIGVSGLIIVDTENGLLVAEEKRIDELKNVLEKMENQVVFEKFLCCRNADK